MTMIIGIIAETGIILASDTRCMIGDPPNYIGYHDQARKIVLSPHQALSPIACAIARSGRIEFNGTTTQATQKVLSNPRFVPTTLLSHVHDEFERPYKAINSELPIAKLSIVAIFAKFENGCPCLSYGNLSTEIQCIRKSGMFSHPGLTDNPFENIMPSKDKAVQFVRDSIIKRSSPKSGIGSVIDIIHLTSHNIEYVQGQDRDILPTQPKKLYEEYKRNPSIITLLAESNLLEEWFKRYSH